MMLDAAIELASSGYAVLPLRPCDKKPPMVKGGYKAATRDAEQIRWWWARWPRANIGTRTGDQFAVVDVDHRHGGTMEAAAALGLPLDTRAVKTPGGVQLHLVTNGSVTSRAGTLAEGIDVWGEGHYVVLPPSVRTDGKYEWLRGLDVPMLHADATLLNTVNVAPEGAVGLDGRVRRRLRPEEVKEGQRHDTLIAWAAWFANQNASPLEIEQLLSEFNRRMADPLPEDEVDGIVRWINSNQNPNPLAAPAA
jgi:hypothetical protein